MPNRLRPEEAVALFVGAFVLFVTFGMLLPPSALTLALLQVGCFAAPAILVVRWRGVPLRSGLGLAAPHPLALVGAVLIGVSFWFLSLSLTLWLFDDLPHIEREVSWSGASMWIRFATVVIVPAVCEELLIRGVVARALRPALGIAGAVVLTAALFAGLHLPPVRMLPAGLFGLVLGYAAVVTDSVLPAMLMHFLNNLMAVVVIPGVPTIEIAISGHPVAAGVAASALTACGGAMLWRSRVSAPQ